MMAYLAMMAPRLVELQRVLKETGSLYLHCDPTASHYLRMTLDAIFGGENFRNEIIWKRTTAHNSGKKFGSVHDTLFFYAKSESKLAINTRLAHARSFRFRREHARQRRAHANRQDGGRDYQGPDYFSLP